MQKVGLVLEGGSMRAMFTMGVLDVFMDENIEVDGIIGVSAGALFGPNYYSKQRSRALRYNKRFCKDPRFISIWSLLFTGNLVNRKFAFYDVTYKHDVFDDETFKKNNKGYYATVTNVETGKAEYLEMKDVYNHLEVLRATSAIPVVSKVVEINGKKYLDGGIADSIPVLQAEKMGYDKIIVVLTRPIEYRKKAMNEKLLNVFKLRYKKYPKFVEAMKNRHEMYNQTVDMILEKERKGEIFVIRPNAPITLGTIEHDPVKLEEVYKMGFEQGCTQLEALKAYLEK